MSNLTGTLVTLEKAFNQGLWVRNYLQFAGGINSEKEYSMNIFKENMLTSKNGQMLTF